MRQQFARSYNAALIAFALGWAVFSLPWLSGEVTVPYDAKAHFQPQLQFLAHALHSGQSPFWTPNVFAGSPQIADPQSLIFSPAILIALLDQAPSFRELDLYCFLLLALAGLSAIFFFKDRGWHPAGAVLAGLATSFGGSSIWRIQHIKQIESFAFFMLCFWLLARALDRKSMRYGILAGLAGCMMIIEPGQVALIGCYVLAAYTVYHWACAPRFLKAVRETLPALLAGGAAAALLAAIPILFSFLFVLDSNRPEIPFKEAARGALHPASLLTSIVPGLYSVFGDKPYWGPGSIEWPANYLSMTENMGQIYIGALPVLLILTLGLMKGCAWSKEIRFVSAAAAALLVYALGRYTPAFAFIYEYVPGVDLFRRPADATYALGAMTAMVSGYLLHAVLTAPERLRGWPSYAALPIVAGLLVTSLCVALAHGQLALAWKPILASAAIFAGGWAIIVLAPRVEAAHGAWTVAMVAAFMTADLSLGNGPNRSTAKPPENYDELRVDTGNGTIAFLKSKLDKPGPLTRRDRVELVGLGFEWPNASLVHGFDHVLGYNPLRLEVIEEGMGATETVAEAWQRKFTPLFPSYRSLMANYLGLRYIVTRKPVEQIDKRLMPGDLTLLFRNGDTYIYENPGALPRVIFATDWMHADFDKMLKDGRWPIFDPMRTVLLRDPPPRISSGLTMPVAVAKPSIILESYRNTEIEIEVATPKSGYLVLNDIWHPWWFASVDGKETEILQANVLFRAVQVPAGRHTVRFEFRPVEGAIKEIEARLKSEPAKPAEPMDIHLRPEASLEGVMQAAFAAPRSLR